MANLSNRYIKQPWKYLWGEKWHSIDTNGPRFLSQQNHANFSKGYSDADAAGTRAPVSSYFGYNPQAQYSAGQIGDGNGLGVGDWRFAFAGIDPMNPTQPVPPPRTDGEPVPRLVRVNGNNSPALPMGPSRSPYSPGGLAEWMTTMAGVDPQNPNQFAPSPLDDGLRDFYRDDPAWRLQLRR